MTDKPQISEHAKRLAWQVMAGFGAPQYGTTGVEDHKAKLEGLAQIAIDAATAELRAKNDSMGGQLESIVDEIVCEGGVTESTPNAAGSIVSTEPTPYEMLCDVLGKLRAEVELQKKVISSVCNSPATAWRELITERGQLKAEVERITSDYLNADRKAAENAAEAGGLLAERDQLRKDAVEHIKRAYSEGALQDQCDSMTDWESKYGGEK